MDDSGEDNTDDSTEDDTVSDGTEDAGNISEPKDELKELEEELFKDLTPGRNKQVEKQIELKQQYVVLFDSISDITNRINKITKTTDNNNTIEFIINKMAELKDLIYFILIILICYKDVYWEYYELSTIYCHFINK